MPKIGDVEYSEEAFAHMRRLHALAVEAGDMDDRERRSALLREAETVHAFHEEFPGLTWHDRPDPDQNRVGKFQRPGDAAPTQRLAAIQAMPRTGTARRRVLDFIRVAGDAGATDEEIQQGLGMNPSTQRPRRVELVEGHWIKDSGRTRRTDSGMAAVVWVAS